MRTDEDIIAEARRVSEQLRSAAMLLEQFTGRLDALTAELITGTRESENNDPTESER